MEPAQLEPHLSTDLEEVMDQPQKHFEEASSREEKYNCNGEGCLE